MPEKNNTQENTQPIPTILSQTRLPTADSRAFEDIVNKDGFNVFHSIVATAAATAANYGIIFTATNPCAVIRIIESHTVVGSDGSAVTLNVERLEPADALDGGDVILTTAFNLKSTINTPVIKESIDMVKAARTLSQGDRLALVDAGTLTAVAGVQVTIYLFPLGKGHYK